jgi:hypothetical protein
MLEELERHRALRANLLSSPGGGSVAARTVAEGQINAELRKQKQHHRLDPANAAREH